MKENEYLVLKKWISEKQDRQLNKLQYFVDHLKLQFWF
jgi:hypothetical protein